MLFACLTGFAMLASDLPDELKNVPEESISRVNHFIGKRVKDPESDQKVSVVMEPAKNAKKYPGVLMGVYDPGHKKVNRAVIAVTRVKIKDEKYHWYKIPSLPHALDLSGDQRILIYFENWSIGCYLPKFKGKYEYWVSVRAQGPYYVDGSAREDKLFLDQVIVVKIK